MLFLPWTNANTNTDNTDFNFLEYISQCCNNSSPLRIIPRGAIITVADALRGLLDSAVGDRSLLSWSKLLEGLGYNSQM